MAECASSLSQSMPAACTARLSTVCPYAMPARVTVSNVLNGWNGLRLCDVRATAAINAAVARTSHKRNPFHPFSTFDTVTLAGMAYGQTVLSRAVQAAGMDWDSDEAHSAIYDTERTAQLFCRILN